MRFYNQQHKFYCGIDLHARKMYVCILDQQGKTRVHQNIKTDPERLFDIIFPFLEDVVICVECMFSCWASIVNLILLIINPSNKRLFTCLENFLPVASVR